MSGSRIPERQAALDALIREYLPNPPSAGPKSRRDGGSPNLTDEEILDLLRQARNGAKFEDLYDRGDTTHYGGDDSRADLALLNKMAFYSQDAAQLDRLFRGSALMRPKWDERRGALTYGYRTIEAALNSNVESYRRANERVPPPSTASPSTASKMGEPGVVLADVVPEQVDWLWERRIAMGKLTIIEGDPGLGKSAVTTDMATRISVGRSWPDGAPCEAGGVVLLSAEDGLADTIRPRIDASGGDPRKILALTTVPDRAGERLISIPADLDFIRRAIERVRAILVVIDPIMAFLGADVNSYRDQDVRRALAPLAKLAEETAAAILLVRHLTKSTGGNPLYRGGGSIGIVGAARSAFLVAKDPEDENRRDIAPLKSNLASPAASLAFTLVEAQNGAVRVEWKGETSHTAAGLLASPTDPEERSALEEAKEFLRKALADGPIWSTHVKKEAREAGITEITLKRAKTAVGVSSEKEGGGAWSWSLPQPKAIKGGRAPNHDSDDPLDPLRPDTPDVAAQGDQDVQGDQGDRSRRHDPVNRSPHKRPLVVDDVYQHDPDCDCEWCALE